MDGEAEWFLLFLAILAVATIATHFWRSLCERLIKASCEDNRPLQKVLLSSVQTPVIFYIWFFAAFIIIDLITDKYFSEHVPRFFYIVPYIIAVFALTWVLLSLKKNVTGFLLAQSRIGAISLAPGRVMALAKLLTIVILLIALLLLMEVTGVSFTTFLAVSGIGGLALAFASQEIISNFFGGLMVHTVQPFSIGEHISVVGTPIEGVVEDIGWYETQLRTKDLQPIFIPNAQFSKASVINNSRRTERKIVEKLPVSLADMKKLSQILDDLQKLLGDTEIVNTNKPFYAFIEQIGPYSVDIVLQAFSSCMAEIEYVTARNKLLMQAAGVIETHGGKLTMALPPFKKE